MTRGIVDSRAPAIIAQDQPQEKFNLEQEIEACFIAPLVLPEGRIIILEDGFVYHGRLIVPDNAKRRPTTGRVLRVSNPDTLGNLVGQRIIYGTWSGTPLKFKNASKYRVLETREVLAILDGNDNAELEDTDS